MSNTEKIIKGAAIVLAVIIIMSIIKLICSIIGSLLLVFSLSDSSDGKMYDIDKEIHNLRVETISILNIEKGEEFKVETNNGNIKIKEDKDSLIITEKKRFNLFRKNDYYITIYVPEDFEFNKVDIENGAGIINFEEINAEILDLKLGAGVSKIGSINITEKANIETGAGKLSIKQGVVKNLRLEVGTGSVDISSKLVGNSDISVGVGKLDVNLDEDISKYTFSVETGIGEVKINNQKVKSNEKVGDGEYLVNVSNGIGSINISGLEVTND